MAITLVTTLSGEDANSYVDVSYADDYFDNHYSITKQTAWQALSDGQKQQLLVQACRILEMLRFTEPEEPVASNYHMEWRRDLNAVISMANTERPYKYSSLQALQFPRSMDVLENGSVIVPEEIKMAQCEQAVYLLSVDETAVNAQMQGVKRDTIVVQQSQITLSQVYSGNGTLLSPVALEFVRPYLIKTSTRLMRK